jgi:hypothetical protein
VWVIIPLLVMAAAPAVWWLRVTLALNRNLAPLRAAGLPTDGKELNQWYAGVPDSENAAVVMAEAFALLRKFPDQNTDWDASPSLDRREQWTDEARKLVIEYVAMNSNALDLARKAVQRPRCRYPADFSGGLEPTGLSHLAGLKRLARTFASRAALAAEASRTQECAEDIGLILQLAHTLDREPGGVSQLTRNAILSIAGLVIERVLNATTLDENSADWLLVGFSNAAGTNSLWVAFNGERAVVAQFFQEHWYYVGRNDLNYYFSAMQSNMALSASGPPASLALTNPAYQYRELAIGRKLVWSATFLELLTHLVVKDATTQTRIRLAQVALAVERFRRVRGRLPESLTELAPEFIAAIPADPFDCAPLRYRRLEKGYLVSSIGADGHDDGGRERPKSPTLTYDEQKNRSFPQPPPGELAPPPKPITYDLTFTVER